MRCSLAIGFCILAVGALGLAVPLPSTEVESLYPDLYEPGPVSAPLPQPTHSGPVYHLPPFYNRRIPITAETLVPHPFGVASSTLSTVTTTTSIPPTQAQTSTPTKTAAATHQILPRQTDMEGWRATVAAMIEEFRANVAAEIDQARGEAPEYAS